MVTSCGFISSASLRILEQIKNKCTIEILYIKPDRSLLSQEKILNDNTLFNIFQEYARSGLFKRIYLIDNVEVGKIIGNVPLREHYDKINELIVSTIHMVNVFNNSDSEMNTFGGLVDPARISTFSLLNYETNEEKLFFPLDMPREKRYYYGVPEKILQTDKNLLTNITEQLKNLRWHDKMKISYGVFSTSYDVLYIYGLLSGSLIQNNNFKLDKETSL